MKNKYSKKHLGIFMYVSGILAILAISFAYQLIKNLNYNLASCQILSTSPETVEHITDSMVFSTSIWVFLYWMITMVVMYIIIKKYFVRPMHELEEMSNQIESTQGLLIQQEKLASIGHLAAGVAHELNNPIGFVNSNMTALKDYIPELQTYINFLESKVDQETLSNQPSDDIDFILSDIPELVEESLEGISRVTNIVKSLKDYARVDLEDRIDYDINEGVLATLTVSKNAYKYIADVQQELADVPLLIANGNQINEVLLNLIVNAAHAIELKDTKEKGQITVKTYADTSYVYCSIQDTGQGIPEEYLSKIFDPFFTTKEPGKGTGLGLNIAYDIVVNKHGGELNVTTTVGVGTEFTVKLPIEREIELDESN